MDAAEETNGGLLFRTRRGGSHTQHHIILVWRSKIMTMYKKVVYFVACLVLSAATSPLAAQGLVQQYKYVIWFSYCDGKSPSPSTAFTTQAEAQQTARNLESMRGPKGEVLYCNVQV